MESKIRKYRKVIALALSLVMLAGVMYANGYTVGIIAAAEEEEGNDTTEEPTATPTVSPAASPTVTPTVAPTDTPTTEPAATPTAVPTTVPTKSPVSAVTVRLNSQKQYAAVGQKVTLTAAAANASGTVSYAWYEGKKHLGTSGSASYTVSIGAAGNHVYQCIVTAGNGSASSNEVSVVGYRAVFSVKPGKTVKASAILGDASGSVSSVSFAKQAKKYRQYLKINNKKHSVKVKKYCPKTATLCLQLKDKTKLAIQIGTVPDAAVSLKLIRGKTAIRVSGKHMENITQIQLGKQKKAIITMKKNRKKANYTATINNGRKVTTRTYYIQCVYQTPEFGKTKAGWIKVKAR